MGDHSTALRHSALDGMLVAVMPATVTASPSQTLLHPQDDATRARLQSALFDPTYPCTEALVVPAWSLADALFHHVVANSDAIARNAWYARTVFERALREQRACVAHPGRLVLALARLQHCGFTHSADIAEVAVVATKLAALWRGLWRGNRLLRLPNGAIPYTAPPRALGTMALRYRPPTWGVATPITGEGVRPSGDVYLQVRGLTLSQAVAQLRDLDHMCCGFVITAPHTPSPLPQASPPPPPTSTKQTPSGKRSRDGEPDTSVAQPLFPSALHAQKRKASGVGPDDNRGGLCTVQFIAYDALFPLRCDVVEARDPTAALGPTASAKTTISRLVLHPGAYCAIGNGPSLAANRRATVEFKPFTLAEAGVASTDVASSAANAAGDGVGGAPESVVLPDVSPLMASHAAHPPPPARSDLGACVATAGPGPLDDPTTAPTGRCDGPWLGAPRTARGDTKGALVKYYSAAEYGPDAVLRLGDDVAMDLGAMRHADAATSTVIVRIVGLFQVLEQRSNPDGANDDVPPCVPCVEVVQWVTGVNPRCPQELAWPVPPAPSVHPLDAVAHKVRVVKMSTLPSEVVYRTHRVGLSRLPELYLGCWACYLKTPTHYFTARLAQVGTTAAAAGSASGCVGRLDFMDGVDAAVVHSVASHVDSCQHSFDTVDGDGGANGATPATVAATPYPRVPRCLLQPVRPVPTTAGVDAAVHNRSGRTQTVAQGLPRPKPMYPRPPTPQRPPTPLRPPSPPTKMRRTS